MSFFFFNDTATTEIYTLSLHDALPISATASAITARFRKFSRPLAASQSTPNRIRKFDAGDHTSSLPRARLVKRSDRKSTRLNSSHSQISYAVFCLKKKNKRRDLQYHLQ